MFHCALKRKSKLIFVVLFSAPPSFQPNPTIPDISRRHAPPPINIRAQPEGKNIECGRDFSLNFRSFCKVGILGIIPLACITRANSNETQGRLQGTCKGSLLRWAAAARGCVLSQPRVILA